MPKKPLARKMTRDEKRNLDVEIGFIEGVVRKDPGFVEALQILGDDYTKRGRFDDGLKVDEQLAELRPQDATVLYNLACSYSLCFCFSASSSFFFSSFLKYPRKRTLLLAASIFCLNPFVPCSTFCNV